MPIASPISVPYEPVDPVHAEEDISPFDGRFTEWDEVAAADQHAYPHAPIEPLKSVYEKFGEECAARNIMPSLDLFEHWLDSDAIAHASGQYLGRRHN